MIRYHLWVSLFISGILLLSGWPAAGFGFLFGAILGTLNAAVMAQRLDNSTALGAESRNLYLHIGLISRFGLVLVLMAMGFYFFQLHVVSLVSGFTLFQVMSLLALWRDARKGLPEKIVAAQ